jgi:hypothetical protein
MSKDNLTFEGSSPLRVRGPGPDAGGRKAKQRFGPGSTARPAPLLVCDDQENCSPNGASTPVEVS